MKAESHESRLRTFQQLHSAKLDTLFGEGVCHEIITNFAQPQNVEDKLTLAARKCDLGRSMFSGSVDSVLSHKTTTVIEAEILKLKGMKATVHMIQQKTKEITDIALEADPHNLLKPCRKDVVMYRNCPVKMKVNSVFHRLSSSCGLV